MWRLLSPAADMPPHQVRAAVGHERPLALRKTSAKSSPKVCSKIAVGFGRLKAL
jgi:hypothetical protein